ncbi:heat shock protein Hsp20 [Candidatus Magnetobacterium bavaricum]|uniref:Heat shock protein Hsp20 n=1 Tax=Candidatus Magnetobacterium bavaricum TaxID=29290 RepID=A0A0F3GR40_9BACT|nr:heat shock protein Hsp20 [Candidatus Magnetobacterium bavaricum]
MWTPSRETEVWPLLKTQKDCLYYTIDKSRPLPPVDIYETTDLLVFEIDLPGIDPSEVQIKVINDTVVIEGVKRERSGVGSGGGGLGCRFLCMERFLEGFRRVVKIPVAVDISTGKAVYSGGVVKLTFPKSENREILIRIEKE